MLRKKNELSKAIELLISEYNKAINSNYIRNPLAYALYKVWKVADGRN